MSQRKPLTDILGDIQIELAGLVLQRIKDGTATAADMQVARGLLRDNNIQAIPQANPNLMRLADSLPFDDVEAEAG